MDEHELRARGGGALEELDRRRHAAGDLRHLVGADDLQPRRRELGKAVHLEQLVRVGEDFVALCHRAILGLPGRWYPCHMDMEWIAIAAGYVLFLILSRGALTGAGKAMRDWGGATARARRASSS